MRSFKSYFLLESIPNELPQFEGAGPLEQFLFHLSMPSTPLEYVPDDIHEARSIEIHHGKQKQDMRGKSGFSREYIIQQGKKHEPSGNIYGRIKKGFHAAINPNEDPTITRQKARESQAHFFQWMHKRGGYVEGYKGDIATKNGKTNLSSGLGLNIVGVSLAPHKKSGLNNFNVCHKASTDCARNCLGVTAGGNVRYPKVLDRKILITHYLAEHPEHFARILDHEISEHEIDSRNMKMKAGVRLNVTSDLPYEKLMPSHFFEKHRDVQFYDYTKIPQRLYRPLPANYHLSLSHTGTGHKESNDKAVVEALRNGHVVASVYKSEKGIMPTHMEDMKTGERWRVVSGDDDDNTFDRHKMNKIPKTQGVVSGLTVKGNISAQQIGGFANQVDDDGIIRLWNT